MLKTLDLRGKIVMGDALLTQRELSIQIVEAGGEYIWLVKENQSNILEHLRTLFRPEAPLPGTRAPLKDFLHGPYGQQGP